jgi:hypothetical protein
MRKPELCLGFISSSCVHKDEQWPEPGVMAMARLSSSPPRRIFLLLILLVFLLAFVPFAAGQMVWKYLFSSWFSFFGFGFVFWFLEKVVFARIWRMMTRNHI